MLAREGSVVGEGDVELFVVGRVVAHVRSCDDRSVDDHDDPEIGTGLGSVAKFLPRVGGRVLAARVGDRLRDRLIGTDVLVDDLDRQTATLAEERRLTRPWTAGSDVGSVIADSPYDQVTATVAEPVPTPLTRLSDTWTLAVQDPSQPLRG